MEGINVGKKGNTNLINLIVIYNNGKIKETIQEMKKITEEWQGTGETVLIMGDFNARVGKWQINGEGEVSDSRESEDKKLNNDGKKLLDSCEEVAG